MDKIVELFKTYTAGMPTAMVAVIVLLVGLKVKKAVFKLLGLALIAAAVLFFVLKI